MTTNKRIVVIGNGMAGARFVEELLTRHGGEHFDVVMFGDEPYSKYNRILLFECPCQVSRAERHFPEFTAVVRGKTGSRFMRVFGSSRAMNNEKGEMLVGIEEALAAR